MIQVSLDWPEAMLATQVGTMRRIHSIRQGREDRMPDAAPPSWDRDITGAIAEMAVAKWAGRYWSGTVGRTDLADVGELQVRSKKLDNDRLVIRDDDPVDDVFVSVLVQLPLRQVPLCGLCGWLRAHEAKRPEWRLKGMFFVRDEFLHPMSELPL